MKTLHIALLMAVILLLSSSCKKNEETPILDATTEEAATIIATTFCTGNAGVMTQMEDAVEMSQASDLKTTLYDSSFTVSSASGATITYQYQVLYSFGFLTPNNYQLTFESVGTYNAPYVSASMEAAGSMTVTGFISGYSYLVNGQSAREGNFTMKIGNQNGINGEVSATLTNFRFNKSTLICESGNATVTVTGTTNAGRSFSFTGTLVYQGNYIGSLTLAGKTYSINLSTGAVTN